MRSPDGSHSKLGRLELEVLSSYQTAINMVVLLLNLQLLGDLDEELVVLVKDIASGLLLDSDIFLLPEVLLVNRRDDDFVVLVESEEGEKLVERDLLSGVEGTVGEVLGFALHVGNG